jgi:MFS superfamily sulfate permease-like transporter
MTGGGAVVGVIPSGLPGLSIPQFELSTALSLFSMAMIISLLGFMEAISIAKAMAAKTGQRLDPNQELIGQGLGNIIGSMGQSYAVSGSFSRSAVNLQAGAVTGLSNVFSSMVVVIVLLFLTPLLYHLPQSVLAAIIMMAVIGLINAKTFIHSYRAQKYDGIIGIITFVCTLGFAPHLDRGIMIGVVLSLILYLLRNMRPSIAMLSLHPDGTYRNRERFNLDQCKHLAVIRYAGSLFFANVSYLEEQVLETVRSMPRLKHVLIVGNGINELDASGEEIMATLVDRLHEQGLGLSISGLNDSVLDTMRRTGLLAKIGEENLYRNATRAVESIWESAHKGSDEKTCPLRTVPTKKFRVASTAKKSDTIKPQSEPDNDQ